MSLSAALAALIWSHFHPHKSLIPENLARQWHTWLLENFNAGHSRHGVLAWGAGVLLPALVFAFLSSLLGEALAVLGWAFEVLVLYFCLGFRDASFHAASVFRALLEGDVARARSVLQDWRTGTPPSSDSDGISRLAVEETLKASLSTLLGVLFWFFLLGVAGAVAYRLAYLCRDLWHGEAEFDSFALRATHVLDWLPVRAAAFSFAIVGNFQDALESWRGQAHAWGDENEGILLAAGAGALGVQLGGNIAVSGGELLRPALGTEVPAGPDSIEGTIALVWRVAMLWLAVAGLLWLGSL
jgi:adenosylcobinamide-phosphate synthase